jgi:putative NADH-flavin reductase
MRLTIFGASGGTGRRLVEQALAAGHDVTAVVRDPSRLVLDTPTRTGTTAPATATGTTAPATATDTTAPATATDTTTPGDGGHPATTTPATTGREGAPGAGHPDLDVEGLRVVTADVFSADEVEAAVGGADAVVSALGARSRSDTSRVMSAGTRTILAAMGRAGVDRVVVVSAAPVARDDDGTTALYRLVAAPLLRALLRQSYADMARMEAAVRGSGLDWTIVRPPQLTNGPHTGTYRQAREANLRGGYRISRADLADAILASLADPTTIGATIALGY